jgi:long-subunit acyl-CoA synthetase (AMP-forming)
LSWNSQEELADMVTTRYRQIANIIKNILSILITNKLKNSNRLLSADRNRVDWFIKLTDTDKVIE